MTKSLLKDLRDQKNSLKKKYDDLYREEAEQIDQKIGLEVRRLYTQEDWSLRKIGIEYGTKDYWTIKQHLVGAKPASRTTSNVSGFSVENLGESSVKVTDLATGQTGVATVFDDLQDIYWEEGNVDGFTYTMLKEPR